MAIALIVVVVAAAAVVVVVVVVLARQTLALVLIKPAILPLFDRCACEPR